MYNKGLRIFIRKRIENLDIKGRIKRMKEWVKKRTFRKYETKGKHVM
jgi:hypothetical protein